MYHLNPKPQTLNPKPQVQIQNKIASLRAYGMTTFYFMMGIYVSIRADFFEKNFGWSILITLLVVFVGE